ncbi:MAG: O-antigen ligase family protein [Syntrophomonadaceae bacterium]|jgi:hypothetical protein
MYDRYWEKSKTWIVYSILLIYLVLSPVSGMLSVIGIMPSVPWIYLILLLLILYLILNFIQLPDIRFTPAVNVYYMIGAGLLVYVIYAELVSGSMLMHSLPGQEATARTLLASTTILFAFFFIAGGKLTDLNNLLQSKNVQILTIIFYLIYCAAIYWTALNYSAVNTAANTLITLDARFNYLFISDTFAIFTFIVMWLVVKSTTLRWTIAVNSLTLLYITRSRTVFFLFILCLLISLILQAKNKKNWLILGVIVGLLFLLGRDNLILQNQNSIIFSLVFDASSDESYIARQELFATGIRALKDYWFLGLPLAELWSEAPGEYLHNYLSFWVCFGIVPFTSFVAISLYCIRKLITLIRKYPLNGLTMFLVIYFTFVYIEIITSRSYVYPYVWTCLSAVPVIYNHCMNKAEIIDDANWQSGGESKKK